MAGGALTRYSAHGTVPGFSLFDSWNDPTNLAGNTPTVYLNTGGAVSGVGGLDSLPAGALVLHGGGTAASCGTALACFSEVVWTAPISGVYNLAATFTGRQLNINGLVEIIQNTAGIQSTLLSGLSPTRRRSRSTGRSA